MRISTASTLPLLPLLASAQLLTVTLPNTAPAEPTPASSPEDTLASPALSAYWSPLYTRTLPVSIPIPTADTIFHNDLRARSPAPQVTGQVGVAPAAQPGQVSPITTLQIYSMVDGKAQQIEVVYTQLFTLPLDPWPAAQAGTIGLGTIQGEVGVVKTKRDVAVQTQLPIPVLSDESLRLSADAKFEVAPVHDRVQVEESVREDVAVASTDRPARILENKTGKVVHSSAGSALALILAIAAMVVA